MTYSHYEPLSAVDAAFLAIEEPSCPMHVGAVAVFDAGPLALPDGGFDIERFRRFVDAVLQPRYRMRLARMPVTRRPIWVDDAHFNLHYHVRHVSLPQPGDERQLKRLAGHAFSLPLDRNKPLWELWVVEGLPERRFAIFSKAHHCMVDGIASADLLTATMQLSPDASVPEPWPSPPRRAPGVLDLARGEARRSAERGLASLRAVRDTAARPRRALASLRDAAGSLREAIAASAHKTSPTVLALIEQISEWGLDRVFVELTRRTALTRPFNVVVTNVPGPQRPVYLLGAPLRAAFPLVPLYKNQALGMALFSYHGGLFWGLNADWDLLPDLHRLVDALASDFEELRKAAGL